MQAAEYYHADGDGTLTCDLCPHHCHLPEGRRGICGSRITQGGKLFSEVYGHPCALAVDPIEKKPLAQFYPGSTCLSLSCTGCNFHCQNCQNHDISQVRPDEADRADYAPDDIIRLYHRLRASDSRLLSIAYTYTEPLTYIEYVRDISRLAHAEGIFNVLVSAGYVSPKPLADLLPYLDAANIDLKSFSDDIYLRVSGGRLQPVLDTLRQIRDAGVWLEITHLMIPTVNDDMEMFRQMCRWLVTNGFARCPLHLTRFFPAYRLKKLPPTPINTLRAAQKIAREEGMMHVLLGNV